MATVKCALGKRGSPSHEWNDNREKAKSLLHIEYAYAAEQLLDEIPSEGVVLVVHGQWKYYHKQNKAVCTRCSFERDLDENFGAAISCPNCGAMMDGGDGDE